MIICCQRNQVNLIIKINPIKIVILVYPTLGHEIENFIQKNNLQLHHFGKSLIWRSASAKLQTVENQVDGIWRMPSAKFGKWETSPTKLFNRLNFSSLLYLTSVEDPLKRAFYEQEAIRGCWTVKELDRQVSSLYFERIGLSKDKLAMQKLPVKDSQQLSPRDILHNPVTLEFLGLQSQMRLTDVAGTK